MNSKFAAAALIAASAMLASGAAQAQGKRSKVQQTQDRMVSEIPHCYKNLGTISITDGDDPYGWRQFNLAPPQKLLKVMVQKSGCFRLVDRGAGMNAAMAERDLASGGELQRGSNLGKGQIKSADYVLVAEVAAKDSNSGGGAVAGALGGLVGGQVGGLIGGIKTKKLEANTVLSITDVRTSETLAVEEGYASKTDVSFGGGGGLFGSTGFGGLVGGGYEDTDIGRIVTQAFVNAYTNMVTNLGGLSGNAAASAPTRSFTVQSSTTLRRTPSDKGAVVRALPGGMTVFPTGNKDGMWWEVADDNDNVGWVRNDKLAAAN
jgi:curli biogenesis system outer membrane secretion channel CsgG